MARLITTISANSNNIANNNGWVDPPRPRVGKTNGRLPLVHSRSWCTRWVAHGQQHAARRGSGALAIDGGKSKDYLPVFVLRGLAHRGGTTRQHSGN